MSAVRCDRFPCDQAYRRGGHEPDDDGRVMHQVSAGSERRLDGEGELVRVWSVSSVAVEDDVWSPHVYVRGGGHVFDDPEEADRFMGAVATANMRALKANADEARRETKALTVEVQELQHDLEAARS